MRAGICRPASAASCQTILLNVETKFRVFLEGKPCRVFVAPLDVRLFPRDDGRDSTVVQPDLMVVCDPSKITATGCSGAPDLIAEILSPATRRNDLLFKLNLYREAGVREYWTIDPEIKTVMRFVLKDGNCIASAAGEGTIPVGIFSGALSPEYNDIFMDVE